MSFYKTDIGMIGMIQKGGRGGVGVEGEQISGFI